MLKSLGSPVTNDDVVTFALEGLQDKYENVCGIITHRELFLDLKMARSMLTTEEMRLKSKSHALPIDSLSSSPMILLAESGNTRCSSNPQVESWLPCYNFAKGSCRFGNACKFVHDASVNIKTSNSGVYQPQAPTVLQPGSTGLTGIPGQATTLPHAFIAGTLSRSNYRCLEYGYKYELSP
ncbi:hybrid signal transduction histidine kinase M [Tanacetum coccineum]|uniref:Hybrid signal transduction histidine kinase M n=1 Tax=Tanacetum coccineum TaxID=301880 RepID=A0ABQ5DJD7_9ASTR